MTTSIIRSPVLITAVVIGAVIVAADLAGGTSLARSLIGGGIVVIYGLVVTVVGRRSETFSVLAGRPVDERWEHLNLEATAIALGISGLVGLGAFLFVDARGGDAGPYAAMCAVMGLSYIGAIAWLRLRA